MLILSPEDAAPGLVLSAPVPQPHNPAQDLLKRGAALDATVLARLRELNVGALFVDVPGLEDHDRHLAPLTCPARRKMVDHIDRAFDAAQRSQRFEFEFAPAYTAARDFIGALCTQGHNAVYFDTTVAAEPDHVRHSASVAHLALLVGQKLENYLIRQRHRLSVRHARDISNLGVAAMFHDLGKAKLNPALAAFHGISPPGDPAAYAEWQEHTRLGYDLIKSGVEPSAAAAVLHHHQAFDGTGFPHLALPAGRTIQFEGTRIHIFARILAAANLFDRVATTTEPGRRLSNLETLRHLRQNHALCVDGTILHALHSVCPPFPPGSRVSLSDGTIAAVTRSFDDDPCHPTVRRLTHSSSALVGDDIDLRAHPALTITHVGHTSTDGLTFTPDELRDLIKADTDAAASQSEALTGESAILAYAPRPSTKSKSPAPVSTPSIPTPPPLQATAISHGISAA